MTTCTHCHRAAKPGHTLCQPHLYATGQYKHRIPINIIRHHLQKCVAGGATLTAIATETGVSVAAVHELMRHPRKGVGQDTAQRLMHATPHMNGHQPSWPMVRRMRALRAAGHPIHTIAQACGVSDAYIQVIADERHDTMRPATADKLMRGWKLLRHTTDVHMSPRVLTRQWAPPQVWDDIDNPDETHTLNPDNPDLVWIEGPVIAAIWALSRHHGNTETVAQQVGLSRKYVELMLDGARTATRYDTAKRILKAARQIPVDVPCSA